MDLTPQILGDILKVTHSVLCQSKYSRHVVKLRSEERRVGKLMTYEDVALCVAQANFPKYRLVGIPT